MRQTKYRKLLAKIRNRMYLYREAGTYIKAVRIIERIKAIINPGLRP